MEGMCINLLSEAEDTRLQMNHHFEQLYYKLEQRAGEQHRRERQDEKKNVGFPRKSTFSQQSLMLCYCGGYD